MRIQRGFFKLAAVFLLTGCAKVVVVKVPANTPASAEGIIYALPNTVVRVQLKVDKSEYTTARYSGYAAIFSPEGKPVCKEPSCSSEKENVFSIQQSATFTTYGEPDPANVFLIKFAGKGAIDQSISMTWNEVGLASAVSSSVTNRSGDVAMSTLKLAAGIGTKAALGASSADDKGIPQPPCETDPSSSDGFFIPILVQNGATAAIELVSNYCEIKKADRDVLPQDKTLLTNATKNYVNRVVPLINSRTKVLSGNTVTLDPVALVTKIETEINNQLIALYLGNKKSTTWEGAFDVRSLSAGSPITVLDLDPAKGICGLAGEVPPESKPIPLEFVLGAADCGKANPVTLTLNYYPAENQQLFTKLVDVTEGDRSFRYRIPAQVRALFGDSKKEYGAGVFTVAQLGAVISLPANRHSKTLSYDLGFIEATGGLKTFKLGTTGALDAATVDALSSAGGTLVDARNTANKNASELTTLTKEDQLLKLRDEICTIEKKYGMACTTAP